MKATELVKDLCAEIRTLSSDLDIANYRNENSKTEKVALEETIKLLNDTVDMLNKEIASLKEENKTLKLKIDDMSKEFQL